LNHLYNNIPALLKHSANWVAWGIRDSPPKSPFNPASLLSGRPSPAKAGVRETWDTFQNAIECVNRGLAQGIGYEFDGSVYGVDLDHVIDESGTITSEAQNIVGTLDSFTEISPSGTGLHIFVLAPGADITRHRKKDFFVEIYNEGRYFTVTGNVLDGRKTIETRTRELQGIHDKFFLSEPTKTVVHLPLPCSTVSADHDDFLSIGLERDSNFEALWGGGRPNGNESADDIALMNKLAYWCNCNPDAMIRAFLSSLYHAQKDAKHLKKCQRSDYLPKTAANSCNSCYSTAKSDHERWKQNRKRVRSNAR